MRVGAAPVVISGLPATAETTVGRSFAWPISVTGDANVICTSSTSSTVASGLSLTGGPPPTLFSLTGGSAGSATVQVNCTGGNPSPNFVTVWTIALTVNGDP